MTKKYILFDLDGTLIDSIPDMCHEISLFLQDCNRRPLTKAEAKEAIGNGAKSMLSKAFAITGEPLAEDDLNEKLKLWLKQYAHAEMNLTKPWDGVVETLESLKQQGYKLAICTNKPPLPTKAILKKLDLEKYFDVVMDADALPVRKPNPEPLWEAIKRMGGTPEQAVMVGDAEPDAEAARNAGIPVILISFGYAHVPFTEIKPDALIDDFKDLIPVIEQL